MSREEKALTFNPEPLLHRKRHSRRPSRIWGATVALVLIGIGFLTFRLYQFLPWMGYRYLAVASTPEEAALNIQSEARGVTRVDDRDLKLWNRLYGAESSKDSASRGTREIGNTPRSDDPNLINFWGQVVDQYGAPVRRAKIHFAWRNLRLGQVRSVDVQTAADGRIKLIGAAGSLLVVYVSKDGCIPSYTAGSSSYEYAGPKEKRFIPDPRKPVRLVLGKPRLATLVPLIRKAVVVPKTGEKYGFDPETCRYSTNGPIFFRCAIGPIDAAGQAEARFQIAVRDGGIAETADEIPWDAPGAGYISELNRFYPKHWDWIHPPKETRAYFHLTQPDRWGFLRAELTDERLSRLASPGPATVHLHFVVTTNADRKLDHGWMPVNVVTEVGGGPPENGLVHEP